MEENRGNNQVRLPGHRFCPMDDELVLLFLKPSLAGAFVPGRGRVVFDCDLYGDQEPWKIWEDFKNKRPHDLRLNKDIYFFTHHKTVSKTDMRIKRDVGEGTWKSDNAKPIICVETGREVGEKKRLTYRNEESPHNGCWILYEFFLHESLQEKKKPKKINKEGKEEGELVLCLLRKNGEPDTANNVMMSSKKKRKEKRESEEQVVDGFRNDDVEMSTQVQGGLFLETQVKQQVTAPCIIRDINNGQQQQQYEVFNDQLAKEEEDRNITAFFDSLGYDQIMAQLARRGMIFTSSDAYVRELPNSTLVDDGATSCMQVTTMPNLTSENGSSGGVDGCGGVMGSTDDEALVMKEATTTSEEQQQEQQRIEEDKEVSDWLGDLDYSPEADASFDFQDPFRPSG